MQKIHKQRARIILVLVAALWVGTVTALSMGAFEPNDVARAQACQTLDPDLPLYCPPPAQSSGSAKPSGAATPSATGSRTPTPTPSRSATPTQSSSPSPSPSQTTPPPPSIQTFDSRITIAYNGRRNVFTGRVTSESARCEAGRGVVVKKVKRGKDATVGKARTNRRGRYAVAERNAEGRYYSKVKRKQFAGRNNRTIVCKPARSRTIRP